MADLARQLAEIAEQQRSANPDLARRLEAAAVVAQTHAGSADPSVALVDRLVVIEGIRRDVTETIRQNTAAMERLADAVDRLVPRRADEENTGVHAPVVASDEQGPVVVLVLREVRKTIQVVPSPAWVFLSVAVLAAVLGVYGLTYSDGERTVGGTVDAGKRNAAEQLPPDEDATLPDAEEHPDAIDTGPWWSPVPSPAL